MHRRMTITVAFVLALIFSSTALAGIFSPSTVYLPVIERPFPPTATPIPTQTPPPTAVPPTTTPQPTKLYVNSSSAYRSGSTLYLVGEVKNPESRPVFSVSLTYGSTTLQIR